MKVKGVLNWDGVTIKEPGADDVLAVIEPMTCDYEIEMNLEEMKELFEQKKQKPQIISDTIDVIVDSLISNGLKIAELAQNIGMMGPRRSEAKQAVDELLETLKMASAGKTEVQ